MTLRPLRRWYWRHIRRHKGHICDHCGRAYWFALGETHWLADDELWRAVMGLATFAMCPRCFTARAELKGIPIHWKAVRGV